MSEINRILPITGADAVPKITPSIAPVRGLDSILHSMTGQQLEGEDLQAFASVLAGIMGTANETDATAHFNVGTMSTGDYDPDLVMTASTKAELSLSLMVAVRDRAVDAYNEIMRMQV